jgi:sortase (surface protein transpeptidase)
MPTQSRPTRSFLALALVVSLVAAVAPGSALGRQPVGSMADGTAVGGPRPGPDAHDGAAGASGSGAATEERDLAVRGPRSMDRPFAPRVRTETTDPGSIHVAWVTRATPSAPEPKARSVSTVVSTSGGSSPSSFKGRNHVWIPALGINRSVSFFSCSSTAYPGDRVYRWGCAGSNNVYLFGHAHSVFKPLHDAYVRGRLSKGMKVIYADGNGRVTTYAVSWWKVTTPDKGAWAYAAQSRPSLTLQTCVGSQSQYRLIVRLLKVG